MNPREAVFIKREVVDETELSMADQLVEMLSDVPPLGECIMEVLRLLENPNATLDKISAALGRDPGLASKVLRIANSPMFQRGRISKTVAQALGLLGLGNVKTVVTAAQLESLKTNFSGSRKKELELLYESIWKNSLCTAIGSTILARRLGKPYVDEMFLLGLLHDLGKLACMSVIPSKYADVMLVNDPEATLVEVESEQLGFTHPMVGMFVAQKWLFSPDLCEVIRLHHEEFPAAVPSGMKEKAAIVQLADLIAHRLGCGYRREDPRLEIDLALACNRFDILPSALETISAEIAARYAEQGSLG